MSCKVFWYAVPVHIVQGHIVKKALIYNFKNMLTQPLFNSSVPICLATA